MPESKSKTNEMNAETLKSLFAQSSLNSGDDKEMTLTDKEKAGFTKAFEDPEFRKMFAEYMDEMQDPKYREETDAYIRQLEKEEKVPAGKELIHPKPEFVAKTYKMMEEGDKGDKLWMNITSSENVAQPSKQAVKGGESWSLPYSLGPPRMEKDKNGENVATFDCCFHPSAISMGHSRKEFKDLLVNTAMEGVTESYRRQNQPVKLNRDFHILKGVSYKSGITATMMVDKKSKDTWGKDPDARVEELPRAPKGPTGLAQQMMGEKSTKQTPPPAPTSSAATTAAKKKGGAKRDPSIKKGFLGAAPHKAQETTTATPPTPPEPAPAAEEGIKAVSTTMKTAKGAETNVPKHSLEPAYEVVERGVVDLGDFELTNSDGSSSQKARSTRPKELVVKVKLPKLASKSINGVTLDISERKLSLAYPDVYDLKLTLPYPVDDTAGSAKYEKNSQSLIVTLPVKASAMPLPTRRSAPEASHGSNKTEKVAEPEKEREASQAAKDKKKKLSPSKGKAKATKGKTQEATTDESRENQSGLMSLNKSEVDATHSLKEEIAAAAAKAKAEAEKAQKEGKKPEGRAAAKPRDGSKSMPAAAVDGPDYIDCLAFKGKKEGYVFKRGDKGVGYYLDTFHSNRDNVSALGLSKSDAPKGESLDVVKDIVMENVEATALPDFEYRQTPAAISVIVKVRDIQENSAKVFFKDRSVDIAFLSGNEVSEEQKGSGESCSVLNHHSFSLSLRTEAPSAYVLDPAKCTFDVAQENMVVVLMKKAVGIWAEGTSAMDKLLQGSIVRAPSSSPPPSLEDPTAKTTAGVEDMKLADSSAAVLYELD